MYTILSAKKYIVIAYFLKAVCINTISKKFLCFHSVQFRNIRVLSNEAKCYIKSRHFTVLWSKFCCVQKKERRPFQDLFSSHWLFPEAKSTDCSGQPHLAGTPEVFLGHFWPPLTAEEPLKAIRAEQYCNKHIQAAINTCKVALPDFLFCCFAVKRLNTHFSVLSSAITSLLTAVLTNGSAPFFRQHAVIG